MQFPVPSSGINTVVPIRLLPMTMCFKRVSFWVVVPTSDASYVEVVVGVHHLQIESCFVLEESFTLSFEMPFCSRVGAFLIFHWPASRNGVGDKVIACGGGSCLCNNLVKV